ncbi:MAG: L-threonylcarbamoyladenylate synthase [Candidatus Diapherotrites archaeon]|nr:L-threonylcarbamoyladenylate synthase [Candidatus Diapherotrites archaeon]
MKRLAPSDSNISRCAALLRRGRLVVFPTETVYGLGANAFDSNAVRRIFAAKRRPARNPLIVHVASWKMANSVLAQPLSKSQRRLLSHFWPGPLTVVLPKSDAVPDIVTAGLSTVAVRWPSNEIAQRLIRKAGVPIAAPSANPSTHPSPTLSSHVQDLRGVAAVLDGGPTVFGIESTVLDLRKKKILRPGPVTLAQLRRFLRGVSYHASLKKNSRVKTPASPGMAFRHYAPNCRIILVKGSSKKFISFMEKKSVSTAVICSSRLAKKFSNRRVFSFSSSRDLMKNLFVFFFALDAQKIRRCVVQSVSESGIGFSVMNRIKKAASKTVHL